ncbi:MAG: metal ABC transporter ATP-binding protein [Acidimicrobiales bacterium]
MTTSTEPLAPILEVSGVDVSYGHGLALEGVGLEVRPGEAVALIGPNGAGKSTLLKAILGLLPLAEGSIKVFGSAPDRARARVAYVAQADTLDPEFPVTVLDVALMGRYRAIGWLRRPRASDRHGALEALAEVGLAERAHDSFGSLSGGQRQRVLLARAVAQDASLLLLDEPFNGLDSTTTAILVEVLARLRIDGVAVVMSTHDLAVAHLTCTTACLLNNHRVAYGPIETTLTSDNLAQAYGHHAVVLASGATVLTTTASDRSGPV